jgi:hypothetical protein
MKHFKGFKSRFTELHIKFDADTKIKFAIHHRQNKTQSRKSTRVKKCVFTAQCHVADWAWLSKLLYGQPIFLYWICNCGPKAATHFQRNYRSFMILYRFCSEQASILHLETSKTLLFPNNRQFYLCCPIRIRIHKNVIWILHNILLSHFSPLNFNFLFGVQQH